MGVAVRRTSSRRKILCLAIISQGRKEMRYFRTHLRFVRRKLIFAGKTCGPLPCQRRVGSLSLLYVKVQQTCHGHLLVATQTQIAVCQENRRKSFVCIPKDCRFRALRPSDVTCGSHEYLIDETLRLMPRRDMFKIGLYRTTPSLKHVPMTDWNRLSRLCDVYMACTLLSQCTRARGPVEPEAMKSPLKSKVPSHPSPSQALPQLHGLPFSRLA